MLQVEHSRSNDTGQSTVNTQAWKHIVQNCFRLCIGSTNRCTWTWMPSLRWGHYVHGNIPKLGRFLNSKHFWSHAFRSRMPFAEFIKNEHQRFLCLFPLSPKVLGIESRVLCVLGKFSALELHSWSCVIEQIQFTQQFSKGRALTLALLPAQNSSLL